MPKSDLERYYKAAAYLDGLGNLPLPNDYLKDRHAPSIYIERTKDFLRRVGNPQEGFKFVHVTGTSGKGTTVAMVHEALRTARKRVGSFSSPYVVAATEKIRVDDLYISPDEFADMVEELKPHIDEAHESGAYGRPAYFEIFLAIALLYFKRQKCEWVVLEVGAGGRYDATNIIENPLVTAVTNIDYDHTQLLGRTLEKIAKDKAGIIKRGSQFFTGEQRPQLVKIFNDTCNELGATFHQLPKLDSCDLQNAALARAICQSINLPEEAIKKGINATKLPCRFEEVQTKPLLILDGAHNRSKMRCTSAKIKQVPFKKLHLVLGISKRKDIEAIMREIVPLAGSVFFTRFQTLGQEPTDPKLLATKGGQFLKEGAQSQIFLDPEQALDAAIANADLDDLVLVTGSFYLSGELRKRWYSEEQVLTNRKSFA